MKFFAIDLHISVIADIKRIFTDLGHEVTDLCLSGHHWVMNRKQDYVAELSNEKWTKLVWDWQFDSFFEAHRKSLESFDGFICTYPPIFAMLYEKFNKPIIIDAPIRYDYAVHGDPERLIKWNTWLANAVNSGQVKLIANNKYDAEYCRIMSGLIPKHIPSLCEYFPKRPATTESKGFFLYELGNTMSDKVPGVIDRKNAFPGGYQWPAIHKYQGVIHLPYQVSTMSVFEQYTANVPMIFPSKKFLADMFFAGKWDVLSQVSTFQLSRAKPNKSIIPIHGPLDPNDHTNREVVEKLWLENADFYDKEWMPYISYFDSLDQLKLILKHENFDLISNSMQKYNEGRKEKVYDLWKGVLDEIKS